ncbi:MAG: hypothetical protein LBP87_02035 [Planctomycetaceae bacterium]|nr:hypothetical protein [Planctomycetaceae bacterium]
MTLNLDVSQIQRKRNQFCWLLLACLLLGFINITLPFIAFEYAKKEKADITLREVRFNLVEIQSPQYHFWQFWATACSTSGKLLLIPYTIFWFQYFRSSGYSYKSSILCSLGMSFPLFNFFI